MVRRRHGCMQHSTAGAQIESECQHGGMAGAQMASGSLTVKPIIITSEHIRAPLPPPMARVCVCTCAAPWALAVEPPQTGSLGLNSRHRRGPPGA
jgi:hypothetical protein